MTLLFRFFLWAIAAAFMVYIGASAIGRTSVDEHYAKLSADEQIAGLLVGSSRMSQGVDPGRAFADSPFANRVLNFAFTNGTSPYGSLYNQTILERSEGIEDGVFVLEINPWIFARDHREAVYRETGGVLDGLVQTSGHPNMDYLIRKTTKQWYHAWDGPEHPLYPTSNGWVFVDLDTAGRDMDARIQFKLEQYQRLKSHYTLDSTRLEAFESLVASLKRKGRVAGLVLPVDPGMAEIEQDVFPEFERWVAHLQETLSIVNLRDHQGYKTHDGNHLLKSAAEELSAWLNRSGAMLDPNATE